MAKYRVLVIAMTIKNNKIAKFNDVVEETQFNSNTAELVNDGFIELAKEDKTTSATATENKELIDAQGVYDNAKKSFDALTPETSDEDRATVTDALKSAIDKLEELGQDVTELVKVFDVVEETQLNPATEQLKSDYLAAVKFKADLPKETKPADLAKAGKVIADLKEELVKVGVEFDADGNIVNPPAKN